MGIFVRKLKKAEKDFEPSFLPTNRKEHFGDVLKTRFSSLLLIGLMLFIFLLPTFIAIVFRDLLLLNAINNFGGEELNKTISTIYYVDALVIIFTLMIFAVGLSGIMKLFKRLIWSEPIFFKQDFSSGIKENVKQYLLVFFIIGVFNFSSTYFSSLLGSNHIVMYLIYGINYAIIYPVGIICLFSICMYQNTFLTTLKLSFQIYIRDFLYILLICLTIYAFLFLRLIKFFIIKYVILALSIFFIFPICILLYWEIMSHIFDKRINLEFYQDIYRKGLFTFPTDKNNN